MTDISGHVIIYGAKLYYYSLINVLNIEIMIFFLILVQLFSASMHPIVKFNIL